MLLILKDAPFDKRNPHLVAIAGSCRLSEADRPQQAAVCRLQQQDACTNLFERRIAFHDDTGLFAQIWPEPQKRLRRKLFRVEAGIKFSRLGHLAPAHAVRLCQLAAFAL